MAPRPRTSSKSKFHIALEPEVMESLKALAVEYGKPIGDIIEGLIEFTRATRFITDETYVKRSNAMLGMCLVNAGQHGGFVPESVPDGMVLEYARNKAREDIEAKKRELEEELRKLKLEDE